MCVTLHLSAVVVLCSVSYGALGQGTHAGFMFKGVEVPEHSQVVREEIGSANADTLMCVSDYRPCCSDTENSWAFALPGRFTTTPSTVFYQSRGDGVVRAHNGGSATNEGIFRCWIRVADETRHMLVGVYPSVSDGGGDGTVTVDCTGGTFTLTSGPEADPPEFTLSGCTSSGGAVREFSCTSPGGDATGTIDGTDSSPHGPTNRLEGNYAFSVSVTGNYPGDYSCQATVYRYDGTGDEPEILLYPETPGPAQTITVPTADPPTGLAAPQAGTTMRVYWTPPSPTPYGYRIYYQPEGGDQHSVVVNGGSTTSYNLTVQEGVVYSVRIQTLSETMLPSAVSDTALSRTVPDDPSDPTLMQLNTTTFRVSWGPPDSSTQSVTGYRVFYTVDGAMMSETLKTNKLHWTLTLDENQSHEIDITLQTLSDSLPSPGVSVEVPEFPSGPVSDLAGSVSLFQVNVTWSEIPVDSATGVITRYEVKYTSSDSSTEITEYTDSAEFRIRNSSPGTNHSFSITPFSLFARGDTEQGTYQTLSQSPPVWDVRISALNATSVEVSWDPVPLPLEELEAYKVYYQVIDLSHSQKRQAVCEGSEDFPANVSSAVIDGLMAGARYQFQVTAVAIILDGCGLEGERSRVDEHSIATLAAQDGSESNVGTGELVGAVVATFVVTLLATILVYTVVLVTITTVRKRGYNVREQDPQPPADISLKSCLAYGEVSHGIRGGGDGGVEAHIYESTDPAMELPEGEGDGIYEN